MPIRGQHLLEKIKYIYNNMWWKWLKSKKKWHQILRLLDKKKNKSDMSYMSEAFWNKVIDFTDGLIVQCDVPAAKITSLEDSNNGDRK